MVSIYILETDLEPPSLSTLTASPNLTFLPHESLYRYFSDITCPSIGRFKCDRVTFFLLLVCRQLVRLFRLLILLYHWLSYRFTLGLVHLFISLKSFSFKIYPIHSRRFIQFNFVISTCTCPFNFVLPPSSTSLQTWLHNLHKVLLTDLPNSFPNKIKMKRVHVPCIIHFYNEVKPIT